MRPRLPRSSAGRISAGVNALLQFRSRLRGKLAVVAASAALILSKMPDAVAGDLDYRDLLRRERPAANHRIPYGPNASQFGDLYLPSGTGRHPVIVLIHGGCWRADLPGLEMTAYAADALRRRGFAVWNIEHRRLGEPGGGYPGTFTDVADAIDSLRTFAARYSLALDRVIVIGHSAGGHLALWSAARVRLPKGSPLFRDKPMRVKAAVTLAGIGDLSLYRSRGPAACGGPMVIDALVGMEARGPWEMFNDTSPAAMLPLGIPQAVISAARDPIVPAPFGRAYAAIAKSAGDSVTELTIADAGHFELIDPQSRAFAEVTATIEKLMRAQGPSPKIQRLN